MKTLGLADASKKLASIGFDQMREMTSAEQAAWAQAKHRRGPPRKPDKTQNRLIQCRHR